MNNAQDHLQLPPTDATFVELLAEALLAAWHAKRPEVVPARVETTPVKLTEKAAHKMSTDERVLALIDQWGSATPKQLQSMLGVGRATLTRALARMITKQLLECEGTTTNRVYRRLRKAKMAA